MFQSSTNHLNVHINTVRKKKQKQKQNKTKPKKNMGKLYAYGMYGQFQRLKSQIYTFKKFNQC